MNWAELQGDWVWAGPLLKSYWAKLTDKDLERIGGCRDNLLASLQKRYGYGEEEADRAIALFEKEVRFPGAMR
jgi:uncharacterized protein YjbJ (UPF0337 family)